MATHEDIAELERLQGLIEDNAFKDPVLHSEIDTAFHTLMYERHYNRHVAQLWWRNREVLRAVTRRMDYTLARRAAVIRDHRQLIQCIKDQDADLAAETIGRHVSGSGRHIIEQMRAHKMHRSAMA
jgi:DNA-binding GntR family transcriptional regulator